MPVAVRMESMNAPEPHAMPDVPAALAEIDQLIIQRQLDAAEARCRELVQRSPRAAEAWLRLGFVLLEKSDPIAASDALERATALEPMSAPNWVQLSIARQRQGLGAEAEEAARRAIALDAT